MCIDGIDVFQLAVEQIMCCDWIVTFQACPVQGLLACWPLTAKPRLELVASMPLQLHREILSTHWVFQTLSHLLYQASSKQLSSCLTTSANLVSYPSLSLPNSVAVASRSELTCLLHHLQLVDFLKLGHHHLDS